MPLSKDDFIKFITYLIALCNGREVQPSTTSLIKLLYLVDVEYYRNFGTQLTPLNWFFYKFGPYDFSIESTLQQLGNSENVERRTFELVGGKSGATYKTVGLPDIGSIDVSAKGIASSVVEDWAGCELNDLLNHVYFYTEPMVAAKDRGEELKFETIHSKEKEEKVLDVRIDEAKIASLREKSSKLNKLRQIKSKAVTALVNSRRTFFWEDTDIDVDGEMVMDEDISFEGE